MGYLLTDGGLSTEFKIAGDYDDVFGVSMRKADPAQYPDIKIGADSVGQTLFEFKIKLGNAGITLGDQNYKDFSLRIETPTTLEKLISNKWYPFYFEKAQDYVVSIKILLEKLNNTNTITDATIEVSNPKKATLGYVNELGAINTYTSYMALSTNDVLDKYKTNQDFWDSPGDRGFLDIKQIIKVIAILPFNGRKEVVQLHRYPYMSIVPSADLYGCILYSV